MNEWQKIKAERDDDELMAKNARIINRQLSGRRCPSFSDIVNKLRSSNE